MNKSQTYVDSLSARLKPEKVETKKTAEKPSEDGKTKDQDYTKMLDDKYGSGFALETFLQNKILRK